MVGRFYPDNYIKSKKFEMAIAFEAIFEWLGILLLLVFAILLKQESALFRAILTIGSTILLYYSIPVFPFGSFGGRRIWDFSKILSNITLVISIGFVYIF